MHPGTMGNLIIYAYCDHLQSAVALLKMLERTQGDTWVVQSIS